MSLKIIKKTTLGELEPGSLFLFGSTLGFKSEYRTNNGAIEAYIVGSGEMFWGGTLEAKNQIKLEVIEVKIEGLE